MDDRRRRRLHRGVVATAQRGCPRFPTGTDAPVSPGLDAPPSPGTGSHVGVELARRSSGQLDAIALSRDGTFMVTAGEDLLAWDLSSRNVLATAESYAKRSYVEPTESPAR